MIDVLLQLHWTVRLAWCVGASLTLVHIKTEDEERHGRWSIKSQILIASLLYIGWPCFWVGYLAVDLWDTFKARYGLEPVLAVEQDVVIEEDDDKEEPAPTVTRLVGGLVLSATNGTRVRVQGQFTGTDVEGNEMSNEEVTDFLDQVLQKAGWTKEPTKTGTQVHRNY